VKDSQGRPVILFHLKRFWEGQVGSMYLKDLDLYEEIRGVFVIPEQGEKN
jgi:hypothetical protein